MTKTMAAKVTQMHCNSHSQPANGYSLTAATHMYSLKIICCIYGYKSTFFPSPTNAMELDNVFSRITNFLIKSVFRSEQPGTEDGESPYYSLKYLSTC